MLLIITSRIFLYIMRKVSLERYYFVLYDCALTSKISKMALKSFCDKTLHICIAMTLSFEWTHMLGKQRKTNRFFVCGFSGELWSSEGEDEGWYSGEEGLFLLDSSLSSSSSSSLASPSFCCSSPISARSYIVPLEMRGGGMATWDPISRVCAETWVSERNMP